jgi:hypothetical protein
MARASNGWFIRLNCGYFGVEEQKSEKSTNCKPYC